MIGLCDCNNFYASCERVFNPALIGRPVVILSSNDGCIVARSNEAKALGIKMGQPFFQVKDIVRKHNVACLSGNMELYGDLSSRVMSILRSQLPAIEVYSVDEAFLDLSGMNLDSLKSYGEELSQRVRRNTGIPVSIGMAPTKTLAKVAAKLCKDYPKLNGACLLHRPSDIEKVMRRYPIGDVWGIGRRSIPMLMAEGIETAWDFMQRNPQWVRNNLRLPGLRIHKELHGESAIDFSDIREDRKSISVSRSFASDVEEFSQLRGSLSEFITQAAQKLRRQASTASHIQTYIRTNRHRSDLPQYSQIDSVKLEHPTDSTLELVRVVNTSLEKIFKKGYGYKKAGVILSDISPKDQGQLSLFGNPDAGKHTKLMEVVDRLNAQTGVRLISLASSSGKAKSRKDNVSPRYTTKFDEILTIKV